MLAKIYTNGKKANKSDIIQVFLLFGVSRHTQINISK